MRSSAMRFLLPSRARPATRRAGGRSSAIVRSGFASSATPGRFRRSAFRAIWRRTSPARARAQAPDSLRLRIVDASRLNPNTIMPPYYRVDGLVRVASNFRDKPILTAEQIEDVVAFLMTLKD